MPRADPACRSANGSIPSSSRPMRTTKRRGGRPRSIASPMSDSSSGPDTTIRSANGTVRPLRPGAVASASRMKRATANLVHHSVVAIVSRRSRAGKSRATMMSRDTATRCCPRVPATAHPTTGAGKTRNARTRNAKSRRRQDPRRQDPQRQDPQRQDPQRQDPQRQDPQRQDRRQDLRRQNFRDDERQDGDYRDAPGRRQDREPDDQFRMNFRGDDRARRNAGPDRPRGERDDHRDSNDRPVQREGGPNGDQRGQDSPHRNEEARAERQRRERQRFEQAAASAMAKQRRDDSIDQAVAEITARQQALDGDIATEITAPPRPREGEAAARPPVRRTPVRAARTAACAGAGPGVRSVAWWLAFAEFARSTGRYQRP